MKIRRILFCALSAQICPGVFLNAWGLGKISPTNKTSFVWIGSVGHKTYKATVNNMIEHFCVSCNGLKTLGVHNDHGETEHHRWNPVPFVVDDCGQILHSSQGITICHLQRPQCIWRSTPIYLLTSIDQLWKKEWFIALACGFWVVMRCRSICWFWLMFNFLQRFFSLLKFKFWSDLRSGIRWSRSKARPGQQSVAFWKQSHVKPASLQVMNSDVMQRCSMKRIEIGNTFIIWFICLLSIQIFWALGCLKQIKKLDLSFPAVMPAMKSLANIVCHLSSIRIFDVEFSRHAPFPTHAKIPNVLPPSSPPRILSWPQSWLHIARDAVSKRLDGICWFFVMCLNNPICCPLART